MVAQPEFWQPTVPALVSHEVASSAVERVLGRAGREHRLPSRGVCLAYGDGPVKAVPAPVVPVRVPSLVPQAAAVQREIVPAMTCRPQHTDPLPTPFDFSDDPRRRRAPVDDECRASAGAAPKQW